ncbi:MAG: hypothetical protein MJ151_04025, partial [Lachnospiraceae bacterium]|nr:hypothetical protein [Lachnospiraceae bacterium]
IARAMVTRFGMSKKFGLMGLAEKDNMYLGDNTHLNCSDVTASLVDDEVKIMLKESYDKAKKLLTKYRKTLDKIAAYLIEKETISGKEFMHIFTEETGIETTKEERIVEKKEDKKNAKKKV